VATELVISYDPIGDILMVDKCQPYSGQNEDTIDDGVVCRFNADTGEIENLEVLFFKARLEKEGEVRLPIEALLRTVTEPVPAD
jgi:hypothetical protein